MPGKHGESGSDTASMDEATLRAILKSVINDEKLAKADDVAKIHDKLEVQETKLAAVESKIQELQKRLEIVEHRAPSAPRASRASTGGRASTGSSPGTEWVPRLVHIKGFAQYGCPSSQKVRKNQLEQIQATLLKQAPRQITEHMVPMAGFALNHQIFFMVFEKDIGTLASQLDRWLQYHKFAVLGKQVRATAESHPRRRRACAQWYSLLVELEGLRAQGEFEPCLRGLAFYGKQWNDILRVHAEDGDPRVTADEAALAKMGLWLDEDNMLLERTQEDQGDSSEEDEEMDGEKQEDAQEKKNNKGATTNGKRNKKSRGGKGSDVAATTGKRKAEQKVEELEKEQIDGDEVQVPDGDDVDVKGGKDL